MRKFISKKKVLALMLCFSLVFASQPVYGTTSDLLEEQQEKLSNLEEQQKEAEEEAEAYANEKEELESTLSSLNSSLQSLSEDLEELATQISDKTAEIEDTKEAIEEAETLLAEAEETADTQYENMKLRIQYMYEHGTDSLFLSLLTAESISDFLNKAEYIEQISSYDREMLEEYQETTATIEEQKTALEDAVAALEEEEAELETLKKTNAAKQAQVSASITSTQEDITTSEENLADAESKAAELQEQIDAELAYEAVLEQQLAAEEAARIAEIQQQEAENTAEAVVSDSESDLTLLAALIYCEAGGEIYEGQVAVGCVVMNRVRSSAFPNTVSGVIYQSNQFSPVASGRLATVLANGLTTDSCRQAAAYVLAGNLPYPNFLYFRSASVTLEGVSVTWIGNQQFF